MGFKKAINKVWGGLKKTASVVKNTAVKVGSTIANVAKSAWNWIKNFFKKRKVLMWGTGFFQGFGKGKPKGMKMSSDFRMDGMPTPSFPMPGEDSDDEDDEPGDQEKTGTAPLPSFDPYEIDDIEDHVRRMIRKLKTKMSRKRKKGKRKEMPDFRTTMRGSLKYSGTILEVKWKHKEINKPRILLLGDTSGSMTRYTKDTMLFMHGTATEIDDYEAFIFGSHAEKITEKINPHSFTKTMEAIKNCSQWDYNSTDIGQAIDDLIKKHRGLLTPKTTFILITDCASYNMDFAAEKVKELRHMCKRVILLCPRAETTQYGSSHYHNYVKPLEAECNQTFKIQDIYELGKAVDRIMV